VWSVTRPSVHLVRKTQLWRRSRRSGMPMRDQDAMPRQYAHQHEVVVELVQVAVEMAMAMALVQKPCVFA